MIDFTVWAKVLNKLWVVTEAQYVPLKLLLSCWPGLESGEDRGEAN